MTPSQHICLVCAGQVDGMVSFDACAVEKPVRPRPPGKGKARTPQAWAAIAGDLIDTGIVAGEAFGIAGEHCAYICYVTVAEVRRSLCGNANAGDADVKAALQLIVDGLPRRTNNHVRDAIAVAIVGARVVGK